jgi:CheY-like chemotaxis protein
VKEILEELGHEVADAASGRSALKLLKKGYQCDLLLVDFAMPLMNGSECATEARKLRPDLPILFMTGYVENDALKRWSDLGYRTLNKPFQYAHRRDPSSQQIPRRYKQRHSITNALMSDRSTRTSRHRHRVDVGYNIRVVASMPRSAEFNSSGRGDIVRDNTSGVLFDRASSGDLNGRL